MLQVTAAIYNWWNFTIQLNSNHYGMFLWSHKPERSIKAKNESNQKKYKSFSKTEKKKMSYFQCAATLISKFTTAPEIAGRTSGRGLTPNKNWAKNIPKHQLSSGRF